MLPAQSLILDNCSNGAQWGSIKELWRSLVTCCRQCAESMQNKVCKAALICFADTTIGTVEQWGSHESQPIHIKTHSKVNLAYTVISYYLPATCVMTNLFFCLTHNLADVNFQICPNSNNQNRAEKKRNTGKEVMHQLLNGQRKEKWDWERGGWNR